MLLRSAVAVALAAAFCLVPGSSGAAPRPLVPADIFQMEDILSATISPDGSKVAYVRRRPLAQSTHFKHDFMMGGDLGDIWLASTTSNQQPVRITDGARDGSGFADPMWSPDGKRLAFVSTRGGNVRPWVWSSASKHLMRLSDAALDYIPQGGRMAWLTARTLVCVELPPGTKPAAFNEETRAAEVATRVWPKSWTGRQTTANVLESGVPIDVGSRPQGALVRIDADSRHTDTIARGQFDDVSVAPSGAYVAAHQRIAVVPVPVGRPIAGASLTAGYTVVVADERGRVRWSGAQTVTTSRGSPLTWSPGARSLAFSASPISSPATPHAYVWHEGARAAEDVASGDFAPIIVQPEGRSGDFTGALGLAWSAANQLSVYGVRTAPGFPQRTDWWLVERPGVYHNLTSVLKAAPARLIRAQGDAFLAVSDGALWRLPTGAGTPRAISPQPGPLVGVVAPSGEETAHGSVLVRTSDRAALLARVDASSGSVSVLTGQRLNNEAIAYSQRTGAVVLRAIEPDGTYLSVAAPGRAPRAIVRLNQFLNGVRVAEVKRIDYTSASGKPLQAWLMLPIDYRTGTRYPMVTWVYAGSVVSDRPSTFLNINSAQYLNLQLLAAHGYAVLIPSIPLAPAPYLNGGRASDPYSDIADGVMPALDRAIALGIADPDRIALLGQSFGGYTVFALISQSNRFRAAIALAGPTDLTSLYGTFDPRVRYQGADADFDFSMQYLIESGLVRMGAPPWSDAERYRRNSPISYVDKVETPVMIVQGDMDYVPIDQGEEYFTALNRLGKRAEFVRYWGEGHVLRSPANIEDFWARAYRWFDQYLSPRS